MTPCLRSYFIIFQDSEMSYLVLFYLPVMLISIFNNWFYCILLLDIVYRSDKLRVIFKVFSQNYMSIFYTFTLAIFIHYMYTYYGFLNMRESFNGNVECGTLWICLFSSFSIALQNEGFMNVLTP